MDLVEILRAILMAFSLPNHISNHSNLRKSTIATGGDQMIYISDDLDTRGLRLKPCKG